MGKGKKLVFDEIGVWSEVKLDIVQKYGTAYTTALKKQSFKKYYIDGFSGAGVHRSKTTGKEIKGSPSRVLAIMPPFDGYFFIDMDEDKTDFLRKICSEKKNVSVFTGDCNKHLVREIFPLIRYEEYRRALCLLDPYGLHLDWNVLEAAGKSRTVDLVLNFPVMDMNRNAIWRNPEVVPEEGINRMTRFWGDESWRNVAYENELQLFGPVPKKQANEVIVDAFRNRLINKAGFRYVPEPLPMKNYRNAVVYYLFFGSQQKLGDKIITEIFEKYR